MSRTLSDPGRLAHIQPDLALLLAAFAGRLRESGIAVAPDQTMRLADVIAVRRPVSVDDLYWCARVTLLRSIGQLPSFDAVFALAFRGLVDIAEIRGDTNDLAYRPTPSASTRTAPTQGDLGGEPAEVRQSGPGDEPGEVEQERPIATVASSAERLSHADIARLTPDELTELAPILRSLIAAIPARRSRRRVRDPHGDRIDVRSSLRAGVRTGGDPVAPVRRSRTRRPRKLIALLDISGSMQPYARAYLHLLLGASVRARAEVFVFGTRLTRLTRPLRTGNPERALERAAALMPDWSGGTRIGRSVKTFADQYGRRGMAHGSVVLIVSDGWERDDPALLGAQLAALRRRAHCVIWANPRVAAPGFAPSTGGMAAALPHIDALVSGHSAAAMAHLAAVIGDAGRRREAPGGRSRQPPYRLRSRQLHYMPRSRQQPYRST